MESLALHPNLCSVQHPDSKQRGNNALEQRIVGGGRAGDEETYPHARYAYVVFALLGLRLGCTMCTNAHVTATNTAQEGTHARVAANKTMANGEKLGKLRKRRERVDLMK